MHTQREAAAQKSLCIVRSWLHFSSVVSLLCSLNIAFVCLCRLFADSGGTESAQSPLILQLNRNTYNTTHTTNKSRSMSTNLHTDVEMTDYQQPRSSPIGSSVARSRTLTKPGRTPKSRVKPMGPLRIRQTPLPAHLSPQQILEKFPGRLYYNNLLKVALHYDNRRITDRVSRDSPTTAVCQRIAAATDWIESEFKISRGAFRIAFDRECCRNGVNRFNHYDVPSEEKRLAANAAKINEAMVRVKSGGPRPVSALLPSTHGTSINVTDNNLQQKHKLRSIPNLPVSAINETLEKELPCVYSCPHPECTGKFSKLPLLHTHILSNHLQNAGRLLQSASAQTPL
jgi:hypothetical protein